jgi:hypothetical protein
MTPDLLDRRCGSPWPIAHRPLESLVPIGRVGAETQAHVEARHRHQE